MTLLALGGAGVLYVRWKIMGTGPPPFTEVDNPASFADSMVVRVSSAWVHPGPRSFTPPLPLTPSTPTESLINGTPPCLFAAVKDIPGMKPGFYEAIEQVGAPCISILIKTEWFLPTSGFSPASLVSPNPETFVIKEMGMAGLR